MLLAVARLTEQKGIDVAIRALRRFRTTRCSSCSAKGPSGRQLKRLARELGVEQRVFLLGRVPDVAAWLGRATVLVHPARWEGFGLAVLEAMLAGLPSSRSNVSSLPELVVDGETGVLVPARRRAGARTRHRAGARAAGARRGGLAARTERVLGRPDGGPHRRALRRRAPVRRTPLASASGRRDGSDLGGREPGVPAY